jgi:transcriptional regulator with XRE-family HTH domain
MRIARRTVSRMALTTPPPKAGVQPEPGGDLADRLHDLRTQAGLSGKQLADLLGWQQSKVSRLENGRQTPTPTDLADWARGCQGDLDAGPLGEVVADLVAALNDLQAARRARRRRPVSAPPAPPVRPVPDAGPPVRVTVPLDRAEYAALRRSCDQIADTLAVPRVHGAAVVRALLAELHRDDALAERVAGLVAEARAGDAGRAA